MTSLHDQAAAIGEAIRDLRHQLNQVQDDDVRTEMNTQITALEAARESIRTLSAWTKFTRDLQP